MYSLEDELPEADIMIMTVVNNVESVCTKVRDGMESLWLWMMY